MQPRQAQEKCVEKGVKVGGGRHSGWEGLNGARGSGGGNRGSRRACKAGRKANRACLLPSSFLLFFSFSR